MKIYLAGCVGLLSREQRNIELYENRLMSYFYITPGQIDHAVFNWVKDELRKENKYAEGGLITWDEIEKMQKEKKWISS